MNADDFQQVVQIAKGVRAFLSEVTSVKRCFTSALGGCCGVASDFLARVLREQGFQPSFVVGAFRGNDHCWVKIEDLIVDVTATQFGEFPEVHIVPVDDGNYDPSCCDETALGILNKEWPTEQNPSYHNLRTRDLEGSMETKIVFDVVQEEEVILPRGWSGSEIECVRADGYGVNLTGPSGRWVPMVVVATRGPIKVRLPGRRRQSYFKSLAKAISVVDSAWPR